MLPDLFALLFFGNTLFGGINSANNRAQGDAAVQQIMDTYGVDKLTATNLYNQYKGTGADLQWYDYLNPKNWFNGWGDKNWNNDTAGLAAELERLNKAYEELGEMPEALSADEIAKLRQDAASEIDAENQRLLDLYNQTFQNSSNLLQNELRENASMFGDYRNQLLTNEAMRQQAIAGSTRFELDRQQRNAITRGASAAQRLVANINTQLGLQAQSAQQSLDTSNALAQNLLAHRQAQQGVRSAYLNAQNQYNQNVASTISGQAERRQQYGQSKVDAAQYDRDVAYNAWLDRKNDYFKGDSAGAALYGSGKRSTL